MSKSLSVLIAVLTVFALVINYNLYQIWFNPKDYIDKLTHHSLPFLKLNNPRLYKWYTSKTFLWYARISTSFFALLMTTLLFLVILGSMGLFP